MVTYLIRETWPDVNGNRLDVVGGINSCIHQIPRKYRVYSNVASGEAGYDTYGVLDRFQINISTLI